MSDPRISGFPIDKTAGGSITHGGIQKSFTRLAEGAGQTAPAAPAGSSATVADNPSANGDRLALTITALPSDGGSPITALVVQKSYDSGSSWVGEETLSGTAASTYQITVQATTTTRVRWAAENAVGRGGWSTDLLSATPTIIAAGGRAVQITSFDTQAVAPAGFVFQAEASGFGVAEHHKLDFWWTFQGLSGKNFPFLSSDHPQGTDMGWGRGPVQTRVWFPTVADFGGAASLTFDVTCTASDGDFSASDTLTVTVLNPDLAVPTADWIYVSTAGNFTGATGGTHQVTSLDAARAICHGVNRPFRLLCRRGETFTKTATIWDVGGLHLDCFGDIADPLPILDSAAGFTFRSKVQEFSATNWDLRGGYDPSVATVGGGGDGFYCQTGPTQTARATVYGCRFSGYSVGVRSLTRTGLLAVVGNDITDWYDFGIFVAEGGWIGTAGNTVAQNPLTKNYDGKYNSPYANHGPIRISRQSGGPIGCHRNVHASFNDWTMTPGSNYSVQPPFRLNNGGERGQLLSVAENWSIGAKIGMPITNTYGTESERVDAVYEANYHVVWGAFGGAVHISFPGVVFRDNIVIAPDLPEGPRIILQTVVGLMDHAQGQADKTVPVELYGNTFVFLQSVANASGTFEEWVHYPSASNSLDDTLNVQLSDNVFYAPSYGDYNDPIDLTPIAALVSPQGRREGESALDVNYAVAASDFVMPALLTGHPGVGTAVESKSYRDYYGALRPGYALSSDPGGLPSKGALTPGVGVVGNAPVYEGGLANKTFTESVAITPIDAAATFSGTVDEYSATGLPAGIVIDDVTGTISGTPTTPASVVTVTVTATNFAAGSADGTFDVTVDPLALTVSNASASGTPADTITVNLTVVGGTAPYTITALSNFVGIEDTEITTSGTSLDIILANNNAGDTPTFDVTVTDDVAATDTATVSLTVLDVAPSLSGQAGNFTVSGGTQETTDVSGWFGGTRLVYSLPTNPQPADITIDSGTGIITTSAALGTGTYTITVRATNAAGTIDATQDITVETPVVTTAIAGGPFTDTDTVGTGPGYFWPAGDIPAAGGSIAYTGTPVWDLPPSVFNVTTIDNGDGTYGRRALYGGDPAPTVTTQWLLDAVALAPDETGETIDATGLSGDLTVEVTATNAHGTASAASAAVTLVSVVNPVHLGSNAKTPSLTTTHVAALPAYSTGDLIVLCATVQNGIDRPITPSAGPNGETVNTAITQWGSSGSGEVSSEVYWYIAAANRSAGDANLFTTTVNDYVTVIASVFDAGTFNATTPIADAQTWSTGSAQATTAVPSTTATEAGALPYIFVGSLGSNFPAAMSGWTENAVYNGGGIAIQTLRRNTYTTASESLTSHAITLAEGADKSTAAQFVINPG